MAKPFLKWAGGKTWFVTNEGNRLPQNYNRYIEPFLGGASVFFYLNPREAILSDVNEELINTYISVRDNFKLESVHIKIASKIIAKEITAQKMISSLS